MLSVPNIIMELERYGGSAHPGDIVAQWDAIDSYYQRRAEIELPEAVKGETGDGASLRRLFIRTNYAKTIVNSTVTMTMARGVRVYDAAGVRDEAGERLFAKSDVRKTIRYMSRYGGAWLQADKGLPGKPYRVYKPDVARRIMRVEDQEQEHAVLVIQRFEALGVDGREYRLARWYEWDDTNTTVRRLDFRNDGGGWVLLPGKAKQFPYMPFIYVPNREEDSIPEQSDLIDGVDVFKQYDALRVKFLKGLEDEAFRLIFLANVSEEVASRIRKAGGLQVWHAKNKANEEAPELQSVAPADLRQFLDGLKDLVESLATVTRTSVLELNERPVQDIPAQTLRVLYGPQMERCEETAEHLSRALSRVLEIAGRSGFTVQMVPYLPISEDKVHQNLKGLLDSNAYSAYHLLVDSGKTPVEAQEIIDRRMAELGQRLTIQTDQEIRLAKAQPQGSVE